MVGPWFAAIGITRLADARVGPGNGRWNMELLRLWWGFGIGIGIRVLVKQKVVKKRGYGWW